MPQTTLTTPVALTAPPTSSDLSHSNHSSDAVADAQKNIGARPSSAQPLMSLSGITKTFREEEIVTILLENLCLEVYPHQTLSIMGSSGSGKTTLLNIMDGIESIDSGTITKKDGIKINYVTQHAHFIDELNIYDNLYLAALRGEPKLIDTYASYFQCEHLLKKKPRNLSGGEKQRVNLIRSLLSKPDLLILDEPTAALDHDNKLKVVDFLNELRQKEATSVIIVTHDQEVLDLIHSHTPYILRHKTLMPLL